MDHKITATVGALATLPYGLMFLLAPAEAGALYGHTATDAYTLFMARLFGVQLLFFAAALWGLRALIDPAAQRSVAMALSLLSALGGGLAAWGVLTGAVGPMGWSTVAVYAFFVVAWGWRAGSAPRPPTGIAARRNP